MGDKNKGCGKSKACEVAVDGRGKVETAWMEMFGGPRPPACEQKNWHGWLRERVCLLLGKESRTRGGWKAVLWGKFRFPNVFLFSSRAKPKPFLGPLCRTTVDAAPHCAALAALGLSWAPYWDGVLSSACWSQVPWWSPRAWAAQCN